MNNEWQYHLVKGISWLVCRLPYKLILLIGASLGPVYGLIAKKQKLRGIKNIKIGMNMNDQEAEQLIEKLFKNLGRSVMEVLYMPNLTKSFINKHIEMRGVEHLEKAIAEDKGVIVLTGHVGNWEYDIGSEIFWGSEETKRIYGFDPENKNFSTDEIEKCIPDR